MTEDNEKYKKLDENPEKSVFFFFYLLYSGVTNGGHSIAPQTTSANAASASP